MKQLTWIAFFSIAACCLMYAVEQWWEVNYLVKTMVKILVFLGIPFLYIRNTKRIRIPLKAYRKLKHQPGLGFALLWGVISFLSILSAFHILADFIDLERISEQMQTQLGITPQIFVFIALYVTFGNSLLEEFFFRGFVFSELHQNGAKLLAYVLSSVLFGLYHIAIFQSWFSLPITLLALAGLISVGFLFNWLNRESGNILNSWIVHVCADVAIVLIGFRMFGLL